MNLIEHRCKRCGGELNKISGNQYKCPYCGSSYEEEVVIRETESLKKLLDDAKQETVHNLRRSLYQATTAQYVSTFEIRNICLEMKKYIPDDFAANFYYVAVGDNTKDITKEIRQIDVVKDYDEIDGIIQFLIKSLKTEYLLDLNILVERAYKFTNLTLFEKYSTAISVEASKVNNGVYETKMPREVFVAYSSKDMNHVSNLVESLEKQGLRCFVAARNLRHGKGSVENYEKLLQEAMDHCKTIVFVSSSNSRSFNCDALIKELPYIQKRDVENSPAEYKNNYSSMPRKYKKPRVEFRIEESRGFNAADSISNEFFDGYERVYSPEEVAQRVMKQLLEVPEIKQEPIVPTPIVHHITTQSNAPIAEASNSGANVGSLLERVFIFLSDGDFSSANEYSERVLDIDPKNAKAYLGKLCAKLKISDLSAISADKVNIDSIKGSSYYQKIGIYDPTLKEEIDGYIAQQVENKKNEKYQDAIIKQRVARTPDEYLIVAEIFRGFGGYKDSYAKAAECERMALDIKYNLAMSMRNNAKYDEDYQKAASVFDSLGNYKDSRYQANECRSLGKDITYRFAKSQLQSATEIEDYRDALDALSALRGYKDVDILIKQCVDGEREAVYSSAKARMSQASTENEYRSISEQLAPIKGYKDVNELISRCAQKALECKRIELYTNAKKSQQTSRTIKEHLYAAVLFERMGNYRDCTERKSQCVSSARHSIENTYKKAFDEFKLIKRYRFLSTWRIYLTGFLIALIAFIFFMAAGLALDTSSIFFIIPAMIMMLAIPVVAIINLIFKNKAGKKYGLDFLGWYKLGGIYKERIEYEASIVNKCRDLYARLDSEKIEPVFKQYFG